MPTIQDNNFVTFNSGVLELCKVKDRTIIETRYKGLRFGDQTVGVTRFWEAKVASSNIDRLVAILPVPGISQTDMCIIEGTKYKIKQIQKKFDKTPVCLFLSLEENHIAYRDMRSEEAAKAEDEGG